MSIYSGKCDVCDTYDENWDWDNVEIYAYGNDIIKLDIKCEKDLVPYFPYLVGMGFFSKEKNIIHLSRSSFVDYEEREILEFKLKRILSHYKSCKRKKKEFLIENIYHNGEADEEIFNRVKEYGEKANIDDIHLNMHEYYRDNLYKTMLEYGYSEDKAYKWVYGIDRYFDKIREEKGE